MPALVKVIGTGAGDPLGKRAGVSQKTHDRPIQTYGAIAKETA
jgi:hypothetical protein